MPPSNQHSPPALPAGEHGTAVEGLEQQLVDPLPLPHVEHVGGVAPADVDDVGLEDDVGEVVVVPVEQLEVAGAAPPGVEGLVERHDVAGVVTRGGGEEEHHGVVLAGELEDVVVQRVVASVHHGLPGAHRHDVTAHAPSSGGAKRSTRTRVGVMSSSRCMPFRSITA